MADTLRVTADIASHIIQAGETAHSTITVENQNVGGVVDTYTLRIDSTMGVWASLGTQSASMFPGSQESTQLSISPPRNSVAKAGTYTFVVTATSQNNPSEADSVPITVTVQPFYEYDAILPQSRSEGGSSDYHITLTNRGNIDTAFSLNGGDPEGACEFIFHPVVPVVPPGESLQVVATVRSRRPLSEGPVSRNFVITVSPPEGTALPHQLHGELVVSPYDYEVDIRPSRVVGTMGRYALILSNNEDRALEFIVDGRDADDLYEFTFEWNGREIEYGDKVFVPPGETAQIAAMIVSKRPRPFRGDSLNHNFAITLSPTEDIASPQTVHGEFVVPPRVPTWVFVAVSVGVIAAAVIIGVLFWIQSLLALPPADSIIITDKFVMTQGETRRVGASVEDAEGIARDYPITWDVKDVDGQPNGVIQLVSNSGDAARTIARGPQSITLLGSKTGLSNLIATVMNSDGTTQVDQTIEVLVLPPNDTQQCIEYDPANLRLRPDGENVVLTDSTGVNVLVMSPDDDPQAALSLAKNNSMRCFFGKGSLGLTEIRGGDRIEFWVGSPAPSNNGTLPPIPRSDCLSYQASSITTSNLTIMATGSAESLGKTLRIRVERAEDLEPVRSWVRSNSRVCYISRVEEEFTSRNYLTQFWD